MPEIQILDSKTIDQIAAGEVVERPSSVVKELVENAMDAGANAITVEIKDGGCSFIRVTDNGSGIPAPQVKKAFYRHATSKITSVEDLEHIHSLGFRGEALSSIAAVSMVELITKTPDSLTGIRYLLEGEREQDLSEIGAPDGTTIIIRDLFFNTPARKKFLKTPATEGSYIADLMEHLALSRPDISFQFIANRQTKFHTSGSGDLKEVIYRIYGKEMAREIFPFQASDEGMEVEGFLGNPILVRSNRNFEFFFVNGRYIRSNVLSKGVENGYATYLMQHKFPVAFLHIRIDTQQVDVNVHPSKMEVRFHDNMQMLQFMESSIHAALHKREMIPQATFELPGNAAKMPAPKAVNLPTASDKPKTVMPSEKKEFSPSVKKENRKETAQPLKEAADSPARAAGLPSAPKKSVSYPQPFETKRLQASVEEEKINYGAEKTKAEQLTMFDSKILTKDAVKNYRILGQVFDTYWLAVYEDKLLFIDQHAAHEKVKYEALIQKVREGQADSQLLTPPAILTLSASEKRLLESYRDYFTKLGFEIEEFGGNSYAIRSVPCDLYGHDGAEFLQSILGELEHEKLPSVPTVITERLATMACKSAVKGNNSMTLEEMEALLAQLLTLENPYHCPHGRPTIITMSKYELEKKFKRVL